MLTSALFLLLTSLAYGSVAVVATVQDTRSPEAVAADLRRKLDQIGTASGGGSVRILRVSEDELESYVLHELRDELTVRLNAVDLEIHPATLAATVDMEVGDDLSSAHPIVGPLFEGRHTVFFEGSFEAVGGQGRFGLERVRVDGIILPVFMVRALLANIGDPIDLDAPFEMPAGVQGVVLGERSVTVSY
jgi:hypothetical protein